MAESLRAQRSPMVFGSKVELGEPKESEGSLEAEQLRRGPPTTSLWNLDRLIIT